MSRISAKLEKLRNRKVVIFSTTAFWINFLAIVLIHNLTGTAGTHLDFSISKYVGLTFQSAIAFLIVNVIISFAIWNYLRPLLKNDAQKIILLLIVITLVGLSIFPIGLFDNIIPEPIILGRTPISFLHVLTSRTMFVLMATFALLTFFLGDSENKGKKLYRREVLVTNLAFVMYAAVCIVCYIFFPDFFWTFDIIFESAYIAFFFNVVLSF